MQLELFERPVWCMHCGAMTYSPHLVERIFGSMTSTYAFCSEEHANEYYVKKLRESGL